ncbi:MAG: tetratricopeptide repeat protein [Rhizobacter sp.]|nr:tetratricopeptide repeat protein [Rhizobacter sp.]
MALDLSTLWDFRQPALSEQRFRAALQTASGDDALILQTQIARSHGLRGDFAKARELLATLQPALESAGAPARARHALEWGRSFASAAHRAQDVTPESRAEARAAFERAARIASSVGLDELTVDALHMQAFVDPSPAEQERWTREALKVVSASTRPDARAWEASLRNNLGMVLHDQGRFGEALGEFELALIVRERGQDAAATRVARWMVAWTLRALGRIDEALALQQRLEREGDAAGEPDPYVYEELEALHRARHEAELAAHYARKRQAPR